MELGGSFSGVAHGGAFVAPGGPELESYDPSSGALLGKVRTAGPADCAKATAAAQAAFLRWRMVPAPRRGEIVRGLAEAFRERKEDLARVVSLENGKILSEARGEVQEVIDICDFAVGLSRQLYGNQMHSERPYHRLTEQWHPLGVVGIVSAFNFPLAVPGWGWALALVCGDTVVWKPS
ncbi:MAG: aldehyde dehydrogenase family protein, partial [Candidatus Dormibacteraceae bacterium]